MCHNGVKVAVDWRGDRQVDLDTTGETDEKLGAICVYKNKNAWIIISCVYPLINYHPTSQTEKARIKLAVASRRNIYLGIKRKKNQWSLLLKDYY